MGAKADSHFKFLFLILFLKQIIPGPSTNRNENYNRLLIHLPAFFNL